MLSVVLLLSILIINAQSESDIVEVERHDAYDVISNLFDVPEKDCQKAYNKLFQPCMCPLESHPFKPKYYLTCFYFLEWAEPWKDCHGLFCWNEFSCPTWNFDFFSFEFTKNYPFKNLNCKDNGGCINKHVDCEKMAKQGDCKTNPAYMTRMCRLACGQCENCPSWMPTCGNFSTPQVTECIEDCVICKHSSKNTCEDKAENCTEWASNNECVNNPEYMNDFCQKSCGICNDTCYSVIPRCEEFGYEGDCEADNFTNSTTDYVNDCFEICSKDLEGTDSMEYENLLCEDDYQCNKDWVNDGECERNPEFMHIHCRKSCGLCIGCQHNHDNCTVWAKQGECQNNPDFMLPNCMGSCKLCKELCHEYGNLLPNFCSLWVAYIFQDKSIW